jgi:hypothetical protein
VSVTHHALGDATEQGARNAPSTVTADDDELGAPSLGAPNDLGVGNTFLDEDLGRLLPPSTECTLSSTARRVSESAASPSSAASCRNCEKNGSAS